MLLRAYLRLTIFVLNGMTSTSPRSFHPAFPQSTESPFMRIRACTSVVALLIAIGILPTTGCGGPGHNRTEVSGLVTLNGKPMPAGMAIKFTPQEAGLPVAEGWTNSDSTYVVYAEPGKIGLNPGTYTVSVELPQADEPGPYSGPPELANIKIPKSFQTGSSTLTFSVPSGGTTLDIQMTGK